LITRRGGQLRVGETWYDLIEENEDGALYQAVEPAPMPDIVPTIRFKTHGEALRSAMGVKTSEKAAEEPAGEGFNKFEEEDVALCQHLNDGLQQQLFHPLTQDQWEQVTAAKRALGEDAYIDAAPVEALGRFCNDRSFQESVDHSAFDKAGLAQSLGEDTDLIMRQAGWFDVLDEEGHEEEEDPLGKTVAELRRMVLSQYAAAKTAEEARPEIEPLAVAPAAGLGLGLLGPKQVGLPLPPRGHLGSMCTIPSLVRRAWTPSVGRKPSSIFPLIQLVSNPNPNPNPMAPSRT
jgi:hypothetical protein